MGQLKSRLLWDVQKSYNDRIMLEEGTADPEYWSRNYLLGIVSEIDEVLREINWKRHRKSNKQVIRENILEELADIYKFVLSLTAIWGFSYSDLQNAALNKSAVLDFKLDMEFRKPVSNERIIIFDIDGTVADYKSSFIKWANEQGIHPSDDWKNSTEMHIDKALEMGYVDYYNLKELFEASGQYRHLIPYMDAVEELKKQQADGVYLIAVTARPSQNYKRIFRDTLEWLSDQGIMPDELQMLYDGRIMLACDKAKDNEVVLWDDDPTTIHRASKTGITTFMREHKYNLHLRTLPCVKGVSTYTNINLWKGSISNDEDE